MLVWDLNIADAARAGGDSNGNGIKQEDTTMSGTSGSKLFDAKEKVLLPSHVIGEERKDAGMASVVGYNPRHNLVATADRQVVFWVPDLE